MFRVLLAVVVLCPVVPAVQITDEILDGIAWVESQQKEKAKGDWCERRQKHLAIGAFQIQDIYRREANRILRAPVFSSDDRWDYKASKEMTKVVLTYWARYFEKKGHKITWKELVSLHLLPNTNWKPSLVKRAKEQRRFDRYRYYLKHKKKQR